MSTRSKLRVLIELIVTILIVATLFFERDIGYVSILTTIFLRPALQITLAFMIIFRLVELLRKRNIAIRTLIVQLIYLIVIGFSLMLSLFFPDEIMYSREIIYFNLNKTWFEQITSVAPTLSHCSIPTEFSCEETVFLPPENHRENHDVTIVTFEKIVAIIVSSRQYVDYVHLWEQPGLPQLGLGKYKVGCDYRLSEKWYICGVGN